MALLSAVEKRVSGPKRALPRTRRVSDSKMLPTSGQDSFCWSNNFIRSPEAKGARGHSICCVEAGLYRGCLRVRPFKCSHSTTLTICSGGATSAPKSAEGALRGCRTAPSPTTGTIRRHCAHHTRRYISHPDEEGERQFRFAPFGHGWKKASGRGRVRALTAIQSWPLIHFLLRVSGGRRISAQRQLRRATTTYGALHALHTTAVQLGPSRWKILSPLQMDTPYEI